MRKTLEDLRDRLAEAGCQHSILLQDMLLIEGRDGNYVAKANLIYPSLLTLEGIDADLLVDAVMGRTADRNAALKCLCLSMRSALDSVEADENLKHHLEVLDEMLQLHGVEVRPS